MAICVNITYDSVTFHPLRNIDGDSIRRLLKVSRQQSIKQSEILLRERRRSAQKFMLRRILTPQRPQTEQNDEAEDLNVI